MIPWPGTSRSKMENPNPVLFQVDQKDFYHFSYDPTQPLSSEHIFSTFTFIRCSSNIASTDWIRRINDPEHPMSLEQLGVVQREHIEVNEADKSVMVKFTPTIPHCSMATLIGLCIQIKLQKELPPSFYVSALICSMILTAIFVDKCKDP